jgi:transposase-like protein
MTVVMKRVYLLVRIEVDESHFGGKRKGKRGQGESGKILFYLPLLLTY